MSVADKIEYIDTALLNLDPVNPRLREEQHGLTQPELLEVMSDWGLEEIAASIVENGFWAHEALIIVSEKIQKSKPAVLVVVEGNRRLAAVRFLLAAAAGKPPSAKWRALAERMSAPRKKSLARLPTIAASSRSDVDYFLGFRHVTGIKQWDPLEKAGFIAKLVDGGLSFEDVMRRIGSKTPTVRQNYVAFKLFQQLRELENVDSERIRDKFSVLFLSLRSSGTQKYLGIHLDLEEKKLRRPLAAKYHDSAVRYAKWLFGDAKHEPLFTDSRHTDKFGAVLGNEKAVAYLERTERPRFEVAVRLAGGDRAEVVRHLERAADEIEEVLAIVQHFQGNSDVRLAAHRVIRDVDTLRLHFPTIGQSEEA